MESVLVEDCTPQILGRFVKGSEMGMIDVLI
jgi:hypothetical protein